MNKRLALERIVNNRSMKSAQHYAGLITRTWSTPCEQGFNSLFTSATDAAFLAAMWKLGKEDRADHVTKHIMQIWDHFYEGFGTACQVNYARGFLGQEALSQRPPGGPPTAASLLAAENVKLPRARHD